MEDSNSLDKNISSISTETILPSRDLVLYRILFITYLLILGFFYQYFSVQNDSRNYNLYLDTIPSALGSAIGLGLIPMIIAIVRFFRKKRPSKGIYVIYFVLSGVFAFLAIRFEINKESNNDFSSFSKSTLNYDGSKNSRPEEYEFNCPNTEYIVKFAKKTKIVDSSIPFNGTFLESKTAELILPEYRTFCRAECLKLDPALINIVDKDYVYDFLDQYATYNGLLYPNFTYEENNLGKVGSIRGYKSLTDDEGNKIKITFFAKIYYGTKSLMILYVGCPSEDYPTNVISKFLNSLRRI